MPTVPLIDAQDLLRVVGGPAMHRGKAYMRDGAVISLEWDADARRLSSRVQGGEPVPYRTRLTLAPLRDGRHRIASTSCDCPVGAACKHVAATVLQANADHARDRHRTEKERARAARTTEPDWREHVETLLPGEDTDDGEAAPTPLGLQFELRELGDTFSRWAASRGIKRRSANHKLGVRPVIRNEKGRWVRNQLAWSNIAYQTQGLTFDADQHRWFSQFPGLHRAAGVGYFGQNDSWLYLDDFANPLLWQLLDEATRLGIPLVSSAKDTAVRIGRRARISLDAERVEAAEDPQTGDGDVRVVPVLDVDGRTSDLTGVSTIADHGVYVRREITDPQGAAGPAGASAEILLAPLEERLGATQKELLTQPGGFVIPAADADEFVHDVYPALADRILVTSTDGSVPLPVPQPPTLVLEVEYAEGPTVEARWHWEYAHGARVSRRPLRRSPGAPGHRDRDAEDAVLARTAVALAGPGADTDDGAKDATVADRTLHDIDAAEFVEHTLPRLVDVDGVEVHDLGTRPDFRELDETPRLVVSTVDSTERDWFDLGLMVRIAGHEIPFRKIFEALSAGKTKVMLVDKSYFSIDRPEFHRLRDLIDDARELREWETGPRISRFQAGLWEELEELAWETHESAAWSRTVAGLLDVDAVPAPALPAGLDADLRPYQRDGFTWLTFLYEHGLGGVLADDMGLGKTLQTLALVAHAREHPGAGAGTDTERRAPFLVVAPTSVVHNWVAEAARFTPGLTVRALTRTEGKAAGSLAEAVDGADVVVTSYALLRLDERAYQKREWAGLILDEAQFVKNRTARVHQAARDLAAPFKLAITGTPMENNLMELWSMFAIAAPGLFPTSRVFTEDYVKPIERNADTRMLDRLRTRVRPLMMRRTKEMVARDLPEKQEQTLEVELDEAHRRIYETQLQRERQKVLGLLDDLDRQRFIVFRSLTLLRMLSLDAALVDEEHEGVPSAKLDALMEKLDDVLAEGHRALVFSQFTSFLGRAADRLDEAGIRYAYLDGSTTKRGEVVDSFKQGDAGVFLISLKAGGFGLNLTEADYVFLLDPWWNPAAEEQAIDRTHRIGQTRNVMVYRLVSAGTIEEKVMALKEQKAALFASVIDDENAFSAAVTAEDIRSLLE
ncbi:DNA helicase [Tersicoccus solisilvae]|uniref:DNA helicase n=1 Tax=Tersicoccus solisilvae TaxID=1882339 RepID=A0ABQ1NI48_9MICC|nr:DEAD/DEAH box helicase [Tersicoccus solisilvae]GGC77841.1 DNA helicase [Tersicoccus solisilvae]